MSQTYDTVSGQSSQRSTGQRSAGQQPVGRQPTGQQGAPVGGQGSQSGQQPAGGRQTGGGQTAQRVTRREPAGGRVDDGPVGRRFQTRNYLPAEVRETSIAVLNHCLADVAVLRSHLKAAHWNVKGQNFYQLHELFEDVAEALDEYEDEVAERATALGGEALGTTRIAGQNSNIPPWTPDLYEAPALLEHVADHLAAFDAELYEAITTVSQADDLDTADLLNELSREVSKALWFVEAHLQGESRPEQYGRGSRPSVAGGGGSGQQFNGGQGGQQFGGGRGA